MFDPQFTAFVVFATVLTLTPGVDMALVARNALVHGRRAALATSIGVCSGLLVHAVASSLGLSAVLRASAVAFTIVKLAGAAYLVVLGLLALRASRSGAPPAPPARARSGRYFVQGALSNLLNPKVAIFYLAVLPQFTRPGDHVLFRSLALAGSHIAIGLVWLTVYSFAVDRLRTFFARERVRRVVDRITGATLVALGLRLARAAR